MTVTPDSASTPDLPPGVDGFPSAKLLGHLSQQLQAFVTARMRLIEFYEQVVWESRLFMGSLITDEGKVTQDTNGCEFICSDPFLVQMHALSATGTSSHPASVSTARMDKIGGSVAGNIHALCFCVYRDFEKCLFHISSFENKLDLLWI